MKNLSITLLLLQLLFIFHTKTQFSNSTHLLLDPSGQLTFEIGEDKLQQVMMKIPEGGAFSMFLTLKSQNPMRGGIIQLNENCSSSCARSSFPSTNNYCLITNSQWLRESTLNFFNSNSSNSGACSIFITVSAQFAQTIFTISSQIIKKRVFNSNEILNRDSSSSSSAFSSQLLFPYAGMLLYEFNINQPLDVPSVLNIKAAHTTRMMNIKVVSTINCALSYPNC